MKKLLILPFFMWFFTACGQSSERAHTNYPTRKLAIIRGNQQLTGKNVLRCNDNVVVADSTKSIAQILSTPVSYKENLSIKGMWSCPVLGGRLGKNFSFENVRSVTLSQIVDKESMRIAGLEKTPVLTCDFEFELTNLDASTKTYKLTTFFDFGSCLPIFVGP